MHITLISKEELPAVQKLAFAIWPVAYAEILSPEQLKYMLDLFYSLPALEGQLAGGQQFLLLWEGETPVGFAAFGATETPGTWKLQKLYVLPDQQGTGGGKQLLKEVEKRTAAGGASTLTLNVNRHNKAVEFYRRQGYGITLEEDLEIGKGYFMNDYRMAKSLSTSPVEQL